MSTRTISQLPHIKPNNDVLILASDSAKGMTGSITIGQLLRLQQEVLNKPCQYCGSRGKFDRRGNCGACGAPQ